MNNYRDDFSSEKLLELKLAWAEGKTLQYMPHLSKGEWFDWSNDQYINLSAYLDWRVKPTPARFRVVAPLDRPTDLCFQWWGSGDEPKLRDDYGVLTDWSEISFKSEPIE
jgi:hypothetical protein